MLQANTARLVARLPGIDSQLLGILVGDALRAVGSHDVVKAANDPWHGGVRSRGWGPSPAIGQHELLADRDQLQALIDIGSRKGFLGTSSNAPDVLIVDEQVPGIAARQVTIRGVVIILPDQLATDVDSPPVEAPVAQPHLTLAERHARRLAIGRKLKARCHLVEPR